MTAISTNATAFAFASTMVRIADVLGTELDSRDYCVRTWIRLESEEEITEMCVTLELEDNRYSVQDESGFPVTGYDGADRWDSLHDALWYCGLKDLACGAR
jgi:hypothetical protein